MCNNPYPFPLVFFSLLVVGFLQSREPASLEYGYEMILSSLYFEVNPNKIKSVSLKSFSIIKFKKPNIPVLFEPWIPRFMISISFP